MAYELVCCSTVDIDRQILVDRHIKCINFKYIINGEVLEDNFFEGYEYEKFYADIAGGMQPTTSQVGVGTYLKELEPIIASGKDILCIDLSSGISGDYSTLCSVVDELNLKYPKNKILAVDSLCASAGYGLLVNMAADNRDAGMSIEENYAWLEENKLKVQHWFISSDLTSFIRGGRISKATGFFGTMLKICPLMTVTSGGTLLPVEKIRTREKAMAAQLKKMEELVDNGTNYSGYVYISISAADADANELAKNIKDRFPKTRPQVFRIGTTIGSHTGPGTIALFFVGKQREL